MALWDSYAAEKQKTGLWSGYKPATTAPPPGLFGDMSFGAPTITKTSTQMYPDARSTALARFSPQTIAREAVQGVARTVGNVGVSAAGIAARATGQTSPFPDKIQTGGSRITETLFGKDQIISPFWKQYEEQKGTYGMATAPLIAGGVLLDLAGLGGEKAALKTIIKAATEEEAFKVLTKTGVPEDVAKLFAPRVVATQTAEEAKALLKDVVRFGGSGANKAQSSRVADEVGPLQNSATEDISTSATSPLSIQRTGKVRTWTLPLAEESVGQFSDVFIKNGFTHEIVGGVKEFGKSSHDLDILLTPSGKRPTIDSILNIVDSVRSKYALAQFDDDIIAFQTPEGRTFEIFLGDIPDRLYTSNRFSNELWKRISEDAPFFKGQSITRTAPPPAPGASLELEQAGRVAPERQTPEIVPQDLGKAASSRVGINASKLLLTPEGKQIVSQAVEEVKPMADELAGRTLTHKEVLDFAKVSSKTLNKAIGREDTLAWEAALYRTKQAFVKAANDGRVDEQFVKDFIALDTAASDAGRKLEFFKQVAEGKDRDAVNAILKAVTRINKDAAAVAKAAEGVNFQDLRQATEFYRKFVKPTATEWIDLLRYNSMLSSPLTHIINITSNLLNTTLIAPLEKALTGGLDFLGSKVTGKARKAFAAEGAQYYRAYLLSVKKAFGNLTDVMRGKKLYTNLDTRHIPIATKGVKGKLVSTLAFPSRLLEGMDQFFMTLGEGGERAALQYRASKGVKVENIDETVQKASAYRVYRQKPGENEQGAFLDAIDRLTLLVQQARNSENPLLSQVAKFTVPFLQTPVNILKQGIEFSPLGFLTIPGAKNKTEQLSRAIMGSAVFAGAATLLGSNRITFAEPRDETGKRDFRAAGMQPYSVKIGDTWYSYQKLPPPIAFPLVMVASINQAVKEKKMDEGTADMILSMVAKYGQFLSEQSYVKNVGDAISSLTGDPEGVARLVGNYAQQLIPFRAFGGWLARLGDPTQRKIDSDGSLLEKQVQLLMLNVPGLSDNVPARLDAEGKPMPAPNPVGNAISPVRTTRQSEEALQKYENLMRYKKEKREAADARAEEKDRIQPVYDEAQLLLRQGDTKGAQALVDALSKEEYEIYKSIRTSDHSANTSQLRMLLNVAPRDAVKFLRSQLPTEQSRLLKVLTDEEYKMYEAGKGELDQPKEGGTSASEILGALTGAKKAEAAAAPPEAKTLNAIAYMETRGVKGDRYAFSQPSGNKALGRALGKYQITEDFLKRYSPRYLGRVVSPEEFLKNPRLQDDFMLNRIKYLGKQGYTPEQIADIHRHGSTNEPGSVAYKRPQYVEKFNLAYESM